MARCHRFTSAILNFGFSTGLLTPVVLRIFAFGISFRSVQFSSVPVLSILLCFGLCLVLTLGSLFSAFLPDPFRS